MQVETTSAVRVCFLCGAELLQPAALSVRACGDDAHFCPTCTDRLFTAIDDYEAKSPPRGYLLNADLDI